jgi:hypothetical protein
VVVGKSVDVNKAVAGGRFSSLSTKP